MALPPVSSALANFLESYCTWERLRLLVNVGREKHILIAFFNRSDGFLVQADLRWERKYNG